MAYLQQLKDFDESLAFERQEKARQEQERQRIEVTLLIISERDTIAHAHTYVLPTCFDQSQSLEGKHLSSVELQ